MGSHLMEGDFHRPTHDKPFHNLSCLSALSSTKQGEGGKLALRIAHEHPTDGNRRASGMIPKGDACRYLHLAPRACIPRDDLLLPNGRRIVQALGERHLTFAFRRRPTTLSGLTYRRRIIQSGI